MFALIVPVHPLAISARRRAPGLPRIVLQEVLHTPCCRTRPQPHPVGPDQKVDPRPPHRANQQRRRIRRSSRPTGRRHSIRWPDKMRSTQLVRRLVQHGQRSFGFKQTTGIRPTRRRRADRTSKQRPHRPPYADQRLPQVVVHTYRRSIKRTPEYFGRQRTVVFHPPGQPVVVRKQIRDTTLPVVPNRPRKLKSQHAPSLMANPVDPM